MIYGIGYSWELSPLLTKKPFSIYITERHAAWGCESSFLQVR
jgi:hypothetical protein